MPLRLAGDAASLLARVRRLLKESNISGYLVGGFIRDSLLEKEIGDIDFAVLADALEVARGIADRLDGKFVLLDESAGVGRVVLYRAGEDASRSWYLDFSTLRGDIKTDLGQRDFTVDAIAVDLDDLETEYPAALIDPFGGEQDLQNRILRAVSAKIFKDDPVRLVRAVRLAAEYNLAIEAGTESLLSQHAELISRVAGERIREELRRILAVGNAASFLGDLDRLGLLTAIIPELAFMKGVDQPKEHYWDVFQHSIQTVTALESMLDPSTQEEVLTLAPRLRSHAPQLNQEITEGVTRAVLVKIAALLHDVAKPRTKFLEPDGRARFYGHTKEGAMMTGGILQRLRFGNKEIRMVQKMIDAHLRLWQMGGDDGIPTRRAIYRYCRDTADVSIEIMFLTLADFLATQGPKLVLSDWRRHCQLVEYVLQQRDEDITVIAPPRLVDGNDLMKAFGLKPGAKVGELLEAVKEAQGAGEIASREEALDIVRQRLSEGQND